MKMGKVPGAQTIAVVHHPAQLHPEDESFLAMLKVKGNDPTINTSTVFLQVVITYLDRLPTHRLEVLFEHVETMDPNEFPNFVRFMHVLYKAYEDTLESK